MALFFKRKLFDNTFRLDNDKLLFKNTICFSYKNIYDDNYVVQGFTISRDYAMISAYNKFRAKSRIYLYEKSGVFSKYIELDNSSHVGGISYDYINDLVYVTGTHGKINVYSYPELIGGGLVSIKNDLDISHVLEEKCSAATLYFYNNKLYVGTFEGNGKMVIFDIAYKNNKIVIVDTKVVKELPPAIQGISVFEKNRRLYYLFSQSYSKLKSVIKMFDEDFNFISQFVMKDIGLEGIDIDYTGNVVCVFENGISKIKKVHVSDIVFRRKKSLDNHFYEKGISFSEKLKENIENY